MKTKIQLWLPIIIFFLPFFTYSQDQAFFSPPKLISLADQGEVYQPESRKFTGISSIAVTEHHHLWAVWYTGITPDEGHNNYVVVAYSNDGSEEWQEVMAIDPDGDGPVRAFDRRDSQQILMTTFSEEDVLANGYDERMVKVFENRKIVGKGGEHE
jgi:hypothetical protein